jgi:hypothetical protein
VIKVSTCRSASAASRCTTSQALPGHEDYATTPTSPRPPSKVLESWTRRRDASATHGRKEAHPSDERRACDLVGVAGFEPAASSSRSNPGGYALVWAKPNRGPLALTCENALSGSR